MKSTKMIRLLAGIFLLTMITAISCSDDSTSGELDEPPSLPEELMPATVDFSYFENQNVPDEPENTVYKQVESIAYTGGSMVQAGGMVNIATSFIELAPLLGVEPKQENGSWVWEFSDLPSQFSKAKGMATEDVPLSNQESISLKIVATPASGGVEWEVYYSGELGDDTTVNEFRIMTGFTSDDGTGEWLFYLPESGNTPVYRYEYNFVDENEYVASYEVFFDGDTFVVEYERNAPENRISINGGGQNVTAYWNENTNSGWVEENGVRQCFSNFENSSC
jgi:hypothetical protein